MTSNLRLSTKVAIIALGLMTALAFSGAIIATPVAHGQTTADLEAQIASLLAQIQALQAQLAGTPTPTPGFVQCDFTRNLTVGSVGEDVRCLQRYLNTSAEPHGYFQVVADSGPGSSGMETTYFGSLTKAAVIAWQNGNSAAVLAPVGINTGTGFWGPSSRAHYAVLAATTPVAPTPTDPTDPTAPTPTDPAELGLHVKFADNNPAAGNVIREAHQNLVAAYDFTASGQNVTVSSLTLTRQGFIADTDVTDMYLYVDGTLVTEFFVNPLTRQFRLDGPFTINSGNTANVQLRVDVANTVAVGTQFSFDLASTGVVHNATALYGAFPFAGSSMSVAGVTLVDVAVNVLNEDAAELEVGSTGKLAAFELVTSGASNDVRLDSLALTVVGSAATSDLRNFELHDENQNVLASVAALDAGKRLVFSGLNLTLDAGTHRFEVHGRIAGGAARTFKFTIDQASDVSAWDLEYGVRVAATVSSSQTDQTILAGDFTVERRADSPVGAVSGDTGVVLAKYDFTSGGERIRVNDLPLKLQTATTTARTFKNVKVLVDGSQKGSTVSTMVASGASSTHTFTFGNTLIINLGDTAVVEIVADLDHADWADDDQLWVAEHATGIEHRLLDSGTTQVGDVLPAGRVLFIADGSLETSLSADRPDAAVYVMGSTHQVGLWEIEAKNKNTRLRQVRVLGTTSTSTLNGAALTAKLVLYNANGTEVASRSRTVREHASSSVWFGNDSTKDTYSSESLLNWELTADQDYTLALYLTFEGWVSGLASESPVSGVEVTPVLDAVHHRFVGKSSDTVATAIGLSGNVAELRYTKPTLAGENKDLTRDVDGFDNQMLMEFTVMADSAGKVVLTTSTIALSGTASSTTSEVWEIREKASNKVVATSTAVTLTGVAQNVTFLFNGIEESKVAAGTTRTYQVYGDLSGTQTTGARNVRLSIAAGTGLTWSSDVVSSDTPDENVTTTRIEDFPVDSRNNIVPST